MSAQVLSGKQNAALLFLSFGLGQGSVFLAQTVLVATGKMTLLADFGLSFSFAVLGMLIVDAGALTTLARLVAIDSKQLWRGYWETSVVRVTFGAALLLLLACYVLVAPHSFSTSYALFAAPCLLIWAFNFGGVLDGMRLGGLSGLTGATVYVIPGLALLLAVELPAGQAGAMLGAALTLGCMLTVISQFLVLKTIGRTPSWVHPSNGGLGIAARQGAAVLFTALPGQVFFRAQLVLCDLFLGTGAMALFLYARQITSAVSQLIAILRRAEFPALVTRLQGSETPMTTIVRAQRFGIWFAALTTGGLLLASIAWSAYGDPEFAGAASIVAMFSVGVFTGALYLALSQAMQALGGFGTVAAATNTGLMIGLLASMSLPLWIGLAGFAVAEIVAHTIGGGWLYARLSSRGGSR